MAPGVVASVPFNGLISTEKKLAEIRELEKILRLRDEVVQGIHPRIKVPAHLIGKLNSRPLQSTALASPRPPAVDTGARIPALPGPSDQDELSRPVKRSPDIQRTSNLKNTVPEIDPLFLTKAEILVNAEIQLQRQHHEHALKKQVDQRRTQSRHRFPDREYLDPVPDFDVSEVLEKALQLVPSVNGVASESGDENSYYSSRQGGSSVETRGRNEANVQEEQSKPEDSRVEPMEIDVQEPADDSDKRGHLLGQEQPGASGFWNGEGQSTSYTEGLKRQPYTSLSRVAKHAEAGRQQYYTDEPVNASERTSRVRDQRQDTNEFQGNIHYIGPDVDTQRQDDAAPMDTHGRPVRPEFRESPEVRVIRNHILSPLAPRPERVSPLAVARMPPLAQAQQESEELNTRRESVEHGSVQAQSPASLPQQSVPRTRRRRLDHEGSSHKAPTGAIGGTTSPRIKEEPTSPLPIDGIPSTRLEKSTRQQKTVSSLGRPPTGDFPTREEYVRPPDQYSRFRNEDMPASAASVALPPRGSIRRMGDRNLSRYGRVNNHQPHSPQSYPVQIPTADPRPVRASSHAFTDRAVDEFRHHREPSRSHAGQYAQNLHTGRSRSPPLIRGVYPTTQRDVIMAPPSPPPPARIVDRYGIEYVPVPPTTILRQSVPPPGRHRDYEPYFERAPIRDSLVRIPDGPYHDHAYFERVQPLPSSSRRIVEQSPIEAIDYRAYRERDYNIPPGAIPTPREEYIQTRIGTYDEVIVPREYVPVPRIHSVRPDTSRYDAAREFAPRTQSVRPEPVGRDYTGGIQHDGEREYPVPSSQSVREYSVRVDDGRIDGRIDGRRGFITAADPERYNYIPSIRRYGNERALLDRPVEIARDTEPDVLPKYRKFHF